jgi:CO/xanthine dehydrogenase FAD-binding subunit
MFDGSFRTAKRVALGGASKDKVDRASLLEQARKDREERSRRRAETRSVSLIQVRPTSDLIRSRKTRHLLPLLSYFEYENFARV